MATQAERWTSGAGFDLPGVSDMDARRNRIAAFAERAQRFPGVMGTGPTGVQDARGWTDLLKARQQFENDLNAEEGQGPMAVRYGGPMQERDADTGSPMRGLQMAMRGGNYMGGGDEDDNGAGRVQRLANAVRARDLEDELLSPSRVRPDLGENLSPEELHAASTNDFMQKARARTAGEVYNMPEVAGPRNEDIANKLAQIQRQYIDPANIKADADVTAAQLAFEGQQARATGQADAARLSGAASIRAAQETAGGRRSAADSDLLGKLSQFGLTDPKELPHLLGLIQALRQQGMIR